MQQCEPPPLRLGSPAGLHVAVGIALFINPRSRANRRNPAGIHALAQAMGDTGVVLSPPSLNAIADLAGSLAKNPPDVIAIHGGDGTVHSIVTRLIPAFGDRPLPPLALLTGGTMNVVPRSLGLTADPETFMAQLAARVRDARPIECLDRRCMKVGDSYGFVFGNGVIGSFLDEYYATGSYGPGRALWIGVRGLSSKLAGGDYAARAFAPFKGQVTIDGHRLADDEFTAISAGTVREVGLGFKLNHRANEDGSRFNVVVIKAEPLSLMADLLPVRLGQGIAPSRADSRLASHVRIEPAAANMTYTVDGDMYRSTGPLEITMGPVLRLAKPVW